MFVLVNGCFFDQMFIEFKEQENSMYQYFIVIVLFIEQKSILEEKYQFKFIQFLV